MRLFYRVSRASLTTIDRKGSCANENSKLCGRKQRHLKRKQLLNQELLTLIPRGLQPEMVYAAAFARTALKVALGRITAVSFCGSTR
jgi:hypothetical protein